MRKAQWDPKKRVESMSIRQSVARALGMLTRRDRRLLGLVIVLQASLALFDLAAVGLIGLVGLIAAGADSGDLPPLAESFLTQFGLENSDPYLVAVALGGVAAILLIVKSALSMLVLRRIFIFLANRQAMISSRLGSRMLSRPLLDVQSRSSQRASIALTGGVSALTLGVLGQGAVLVSEISLLAILAIGLLVIDPGVTVVVVLFFGLFAWGLYRLLGGWGARLGKQAQELNIESIQSMQQGLKSYRELMVTGRRALFLDEFADLRWAFARNQAGMQFMNQIPKYAMEIALVLGGVLLAATQFLTRDVAAAVAIIAVFLTATARIVPSLIRLQAALLGIRTQSGAALPTFELDAETPADTYEESSVMTREMRQQVVEGLNSGFPGFSGTIECRNVRVTYPGAEEPALVDFSATVPAATSLALVGSTGAGKSTAADVILGALVPDQGSVSVAGVDPRDASLRWPGAMAYVPQEVSMINGTVRQNVALGLPHGLIDDDLVWSALERAHLADFLRGSREGLDTVVGEHGVKLSGGQRQRLGIARALLTRPRLVVLDEATSALDAETEEAITLALRELSSEVTLVVIAHRLATVRDCDQVAYLEKGRMLALGTFDEVRGQAPGLDKQAALLGL